MTSSSDSALDAGLLEVRYLRLFDLMYSTRSVTRTAEQLGQSQPAMSIWLGRLRRHFDDALFVRTPAGMQPTPRADKLVVTVRAVLQSMQELSAPRTKFDPPNESRRFRICMTDASHVTLLTTLLAHVRAVAPRVRVAAARIDHDTAQALEVGDADLAIGFVPWLDAGFYQQTLFQQDWVCLVNRSHPRLGKSLSRQEYRQEGHVAITAGTGAQLLEDALKRNRVQRDVVLELPGFLGLAAVIATTDLIATLPRQIGETIASAARLRVMDCPVPVASFDVKQHWHARYHDDPGNRWLRETVASLNLYKRKARTSPQGR